MKLVSIIVPVYNVELYIRECIDSLICQTYKNIEIIIVDDGSTDSSKTICDEFAKKDDRVIVLHKDNGGLSDARNFGMKYAKGDYISFVDSDDFVDNKFISFLMEKMIKFNANISACSFVDYYSDNHKVLKCKKNIEKYYSKEEAFKYLNIEGYFSDSVCNKLFRRDLFEEIKFPVSKKYEDRRTIYKLIEKSENICYSSTPLYYYRQREKSIIHETSNDAELIEATKEIYDFISKKYISLKKYATQHLLFAYIANYNKLLLDNKETDELYNDSKKYFQDITYSNLKIFKKIQLYIYVNNRKMYDLLFIKLKK